MLRGLSLVLLGWSLLALPSCSCTERGNHAVRKMWADYNTLRSPAFYLEQEDHLPYPAAQVAYYRWMYDKDPGHQLACLGPIPPRTCPNCNPVPPGNEPFEYEVNFPAAVPRQNDQLWGNKLPEPINVPGAARAEAPEDFGASRRGGWPAGPPQPNSSLTTVPPLPRPVEEPKADVVPPAPPADDPSEGPPRPKTPSRLPSFDLPSPPPRPIDETPDPLIGPASQQNPGLRLTTDHAGNAEAPASPDAVWPR